MKNKYAYKKNPSGESEWYTVEDIKKIELTLRDGTKAIVTQKKEGELPRMKIIVSKVKQLIDSEKIKLTGLVVDKMTNLLYYYSMKQKVRSQLEYALNNSFNTCVALPGKFRSWLLPGGCHA